MLPLEVFSALIAVISLLGVIASNYYTYKSRIDEAHLRIKEEAKQDRIDYYRAQLSKITDVWAELEIWRDSTMGASDLIKHSTRLKAFMMGIDDKQIYEAGHNIKIDVKHLRDNGLADSVEIAITRLGQLINETSN